MQFLPGDVGLSSCADGIGQEFLAHSARPRLPMTPGSQPYPTQFLIPNYYQKSLIPGGQRVRPLVHNWVSEAGLQQAGTPTRVRDGCGTVMCLGTGAVSPDTAAYRLSHVADAWQRDEFRPVEGPLRNWFRRHSRAKHRSLLSIRYSLTRNVTTNPPTEGGFVGAVSPICLRKPIDQPFALTIIKSIIL